MTGVNKAKVLLVDQQASLGGGQRVFIQIARALDRNDTEVTIAMPGDGPVVSILERAMANTPHHLSLPHATVGSNRKSLADILKLVILNLKVAVSLARQAKKVDLIYANGRRQFPAVALASILTKTPAIYHVHISTGRLGLVFINLISRFAATRSLVACSAFICRQIGRGTPNSGEGKKIKLIENCLSDPFADLTYQNRFRNGQGRTIAVVGRICPAKGQDLAVDLARNMPDTAFHIVGPVYAEDQHWADQLKRTAPDNVTLHPATDDIKQFIDNHDIGVVLVPSQCDEAFGLVAIEAAALSCIPVVNDRGGLRDVAASIGCPKFSDLKDARKVLESLVRENEQTLVDMTQSIHNKAIDQFSPAKFENAIRSIVSDALKT